MKLTWARMKEENKSVVELIRKVLRGQGTVEEEWFTSFGCTGNFVQAVATAMVGESEGWQSISGAENAVCGWCQARIEPGTFHAKREGLLPKRGCEVYPVEGVKYREVQRWVCAHCRTVIGKDQSHRPMKCDPPCCEVFHNDFIAVPGEGVGPVAKKFHAQKFTEVPLVSVRTVATAFEIEPLATVTVAGGVGHSDLDIPGDFVRQLLGRLADVLVGHGFTANSLCSVESVGSPLSDGNTILITLKMKDGQ